MAEIQKIIQEKLDEIEAAEQVRILHCVESGSRAWGFASPDSDYDVRFVYLRRPEDYLRLEAQRDVIEWQLDDVLDINGWDVQKYLRLLYKSNPTVFEWNSSPIIYRTVPEWAQVKALTDSYFLEKSSLYHYLGTAKHNYHEFLCGETVKLKKYFYVLRPVLACRWILERGTPPPMLFSELAAAELPGEMRPVVSSLLEQKMQTPEIGTGKRIEPLNDWLSHEIDILTEAAAGAEGHLDKGWEPLDRLILNLLGLPR